MRIIGQQGSERFMVAADDRSGDQLQPCRVLDRRSMVVWPPWPIGCYLARGYWEPYEGPQDILPSFRGAPREGARPGMEAFVEKIRERGR